MNKHGHLRYSNNSYKLFLTVKAEKKNMKYKSDKVDGVSNIFLTTTYLVFS